MNEDLSIRFYPFTEKKRKSSRLKIIIGYGKQRLTKIFTLSCIEKSNLKCQLKNQKGVSFEIPMDDIKKVYEYISEIENKLSKSRELKNVSLKNLTVKEFSEKYFNAVFLEKRADEEHRINILLEYWKEYAINDVNYMNIEHFKNEFLKTRSAGTVRKYCMILRQIMRLAVEMEYRERDPFLNVKMPCENIENERSPIPYDDLIEIFEKAKNVDEIIFNYCMLLFYTGLRCQDALDLKKENIKQINEYTVIDIVESKTQKRTIIPLHNEIKYLADSCESGYLLNCNTQRSNLRPYLSKRFRKISDKYIAYQFRHTFISMLAESGVSQPIINALCGKNPRGSIRHYQKIQNIKVLYESIMKLPKVWSHLGRNKKSPVSSGLEKCV
ncbi:tyrosine-type recombinase/integrase [Candidatus Dependentiae bacterium]|nr:tyrosine-type recombinase/integrase [Candidatus Dependentiae bacterium]